MSILRKILLQPASANEGSYDIALDDGESVNLSWQAYLDCWERPCRVLISHEKLGVSPGVYLLPNGRVLIGVNSWMFLIYQCTVEQKTRLPCTFFELVYCDTSKFIVRHEIGFTCFTLDGAKLWDWSHDLVNEWHLEGNLLRFETFEGEAVEIDITRGPQSL